jgi:glycosyltransferase involved in cell wall biosynthesis
VKVLHVIPSISPSLGGPTKVVLNLVRALQECGVDAEIVTTNDNGAGQPVLDVPLNQLIEYQGVPVWFLPRHSQRMKEFIFSTEITRWLWENIGNYDILDIHYLFSYASSCAGIIARMQKVPYTIRTMGQLTPWALSQSQRKKQIYSLLIERHNLNLASAIHCTCTSEVKDVHSYGLKNPTINLPLGVNKPDKIENAKDKIRSIYEIPHDTPIILFLSRIHYKKRPDLLIKSLYKLASSNDFHLIVAGTGEVNYISQLEDLINTLNLKNSISFAGFVEGLDKQLLLQGADIFVLPSFSENFGIAVAEAMIVGLPVIITPGVQIAPEIAQAKAGLIVEGDEESLENAITKLLRFPKLREQLGQNARDFATKQYAWKEITNKSVDAYASILTH